MNRKFYSLIHWICLFGLLLVHTGCGKSGEDAARGVLQPKEAASSLQQAFASAPQEVKKNADAASEALRSAQYEQAIVSLQAMTARNDLTLDQGMAVYNSMAALEAKLIADADAGNANAKKTYELLKRSRRN